MSFTAIELIQTKRDGDELSPEAIKWLVHGYTEGTIPDYQMSAMAMAIFFSGMTPGELAVWTEAMLHSGEVMDFSMIAKPKIDKHSTGGVGDKISIPLVPLVACCGVAIPMISGRGLGHTGGTLDKLETITGFKTSLDPYTFRRILQEHGLVLAGQSHTIVPADRKLYALRDASGTVPSIPLIASSIMSKKLAEGLDGLLLDVKVGSGAFMKDLDHARQLARTMVGIGASHKVETVAYITRMDQPLGAEIGNANEIAESIDVLRGEGPSDVTELTMIFAEAMLEMGGIDGGRERLEEAIESGAALAKFREAAIAHGGDPASIDDPSLLPRAPLVDTVSAPRDGYVTRCDALVIGVTATRLGAGRELKKDKIDPGVGITVMGKVGSKVKEGDPLARVRFADSERWESHRELLESAWVIEDSPITASPLVVERIDRNAI